MQQNNDSNNKSPALKTFAAFTGGVLFGIAVAPYVKKAAEGFGPFLDKIAKNSGKTLEKVTDIMMEAKEKVRTES